MAIIDRALEGRVALVTGGSRGIGRAICVALARRGAKVIVNYASKADAAAETAELVTAAGGQAAIAGFDVADAGAVAEAVKQIGKDHGGLDILVNNAGVAINGLLLRFKDEQWARTLGVNLTGAFLCARAAASLLLRAKEHGRIVNITSVVGEAGNPGQANYAAAKAGVAGMSRALAQELGSRNITVNCVAPGFIDTDMTRALPDAQRDALLARIPLGRLGQPEEIAATVAFLASPRAGYITGSTINVNGGMYMA